MLVLGGARSGKSTFAERLARDAAGPVLYVATAEARDAEMRARIAHHRARRPTEWHTREASTGLAVAILGALETLEAASGISPGHVSQPRATVLVEDLTLLAANLMELRGEQAEVAAVAEVDALLELEADLILVSNEIGMGIVPAYPSGRAFRDLQGRLNQYAAARCSQVFFLVAGLPLSLK